MMKKLGIYLLVAAMSATAGAGKALAQDDSVTHADLAVMLVSLLALAPDLPAGASDAEKFKALLKNQISPPDGWQADAVVTKGDLAVVLVKCLKQIGYDVDIDLDNTREAMQYLRTEGIPIDTVGEAVSVVEPLPQPVTQVAFDPTSDPLETRQKFSALDENVDGADAEVAFASRIGEADIPVISRVVVSDVIRTVSQPRRPKPSPSDPTPFKPPV